MADMISALYQDMNNNYPPTVNLYDLATALGVKYRPEFTDKFYLDQVNALHRERDWMLRDLSAREKQIAEQHKEIGQLKAKLAELAERFRL